MVLVSVRRGLRHSFAVLVLIVAQVALGASPARAQSDPLEPARRGQVHCDAPVSSDGRFTCESLTIYRFTPGGEIFSETRGRVDLGGEIGEVDLVVVDKVTIIDGMICGDFDTEAVRAARFERDGQSFSHPLLAELRSVMIAKMTAMGFRTVCNELVGSDEAHRSIIYLDGTVNSYFSSDARWLSPDMARLRGAE